MTNVIDLAAARAAAPASTAPPPNNVAEVTALPTPPKSEEEFDRESLIMRAAVTYTALNGSLNGAWIAEHTGDSTVAEIVNEGVWERRNAVLRKLTRLTEWRRGVRPQSRGFRDPVPWIVVRTHRAEL
jgi:transposase